MAEAMKMAAEEKSAVDSTVSEGIETENQTDTPPRHAERYAGNLVLWAQVCLCAAALALVCGLRASENRAYGVIRAALRSEIDATGWYAGGESRNFLKFTQDRIASVCEAAQEALARLHGEPIEAASTRQGTIHRKAAAAPYGYSAENYHSGDGMCFPLAKHHLTINSGYGGRTDPIQGRTTEFHGGVDLAAATGDAVCAAQSGVVRLAGTHESYGNYVRIVHPGGVETIYAHMQYLFVRSGQRVSAGTVIGTVGQTGAATGPHLHFEILYRGVRYDPTEAVAEAR